jgi:hypothetical protein
VSPESQASQSTGSIFLIAIIASPYLMRAN